MYFICIFYVCNQNHAKTAHLSAIFNLLKCTSLKYKAISTEI